MKKTCDEQNHAYNILIRICNFKQDRQKHKITLDFSCGLLYNKTLQGVLYTGLPVENLYFFAFVALKLQMSDATKEKE